MRVTIVLTVIAAAVCCSAGCTNGSADDTDGGVNSNRNQNQNQNQNQSNPICGNAIVDGNEECDDGAFNSDEDSDACRTDCVLPHCGDGVLDQGAGEQCDDGLANSNTLGDACRLDCAAPRCGDGIIDRDGGEECDCGDGTGPLPTDCSGPNADASGTDCTSDCQSPDGCFIADDCLPPPNGCFINPTCDPTTGACDYQVKDCSHLNSPCTQGVCDQAVGDCVAQPINEAQTCAAPTVANCGSCQYTDTCDETGQQSCTCTAFVCEVGQCVPQAESCDQPCARSTSGQSCGTTTTTCSPCNYTGICDESASQSCTTTTFSCVAANCVSNSSTSNQSCTRDTDGQVCSANLCANPEQVRNICCVNGSCSSACGPCI